jgi:hypothetical protein
MVKRMIALTTLMAAMGGCEVFKGLTPAFGYGAGSTFGSAAAQIILGFFGIQPQ